MRTKWNTNFSTTLDDLFWKPILKETFSPVLQLKTELKDEKLFIYLALPGVNKEDITLKFKDDILSVDVNKDSVFVDNFHQDYNVEGYTVKDLKGNLVNGVLTIVLEKKQREESAIILKVE